MKKSKKALLWTIVPVLGVSSGVAGAVAGVTNQKTSVDTNNVATSSSATTMATRNSSTSSEIKITSQTREVLAYSELEPQKNMTIYATGSSPSSSIKYEWYVNEGKGEGWKLRVSTTRNVVPISIPKVSEITNWTFRCKVIETKPVSSTVTSEDIKFTIVPKEGRWISVSSQPARATTVNGGDTVTLSTLAKGTHYFEGKEIGYQWFEYDSNEDKFTEIPGATESIYTFTAPSNTKTSTIKKYVCRYYIKGSDETKTYLSESEQSIVTIKRDVKEEIKITSLTKDQEIKVGDEITLSAAAKSTKTNDLKYHWYKSNAYGTPYELLSEVDSAEYVYKATKEDEGKELLFCVLVTGTMQDGIINHFQSDNVKVKVLPSSGTLGTTSNETFVNKVSVTSSVTTNQATVRSKTFYPIPGIQTPTYKVDVKGATGLTYEWYYVGRSGKEYSIVGATSNILTTNRNLYELAYKENSYHKVGIMCKIYQGDELIETVSQETNSSFYMTVVTRR